MLNLFERKQTKTDVAYHTLIVALEEEVPGTEGYETILGQLERVHKLKTNERRQGVSADTLATVACNLLGILIIVGYEQKNVMTSAAKDMLVRPIK